MRRDARLVFPLISYSLGLCTSVANQFYVLFTPTRLVNLLRDKAFFSAGPDGWFRGGIELVILCCLALGDPQ